jgi:hypothetical protein
METGPTGIEPATPGLKVRCSSLTELRALMLRLLEGETSWGFLAFLSWRVRKVRVSAVV